MRNFLEETTPQGERTVLDSPGKIYPANGAILATKAPALPPPDYEIAERDRLFDQLQQLQRQGDASPATKQRIGELEERLNVLLEKS